jgi:hypothetical protein
MDTHFILQQKIKGKIKVKYVMDTHFILQQKIKGKIKGKVVLVLN